MLKLEIKLNNERIISEGRYEPESIMKSLDCAFLKCGFKKEVLKDGTVCFWGNKHPDNFVNFGKLITTLKNKEWVMPYLEKWLWFNSDGQIDEKCFRVEDLLYHYTNQRSA